jgi:hypothetical protein
MNDNIGSSGVLRLSQDQGQWTMAREHARRAGRTRGMVWNVAHPPKPNDESVLQMIHENILGSYERFLLEDEQLLRDNYQDRCDLVETIDHGESEKARVVTQNHMSRFNQYMNQIE